MTNLGQFLLILTVTVALGLANAMVMARLGPWVWARRTVTMILALLLGALTGAIITNFFP